MAIRLRNAAKRAARRKRMSKLEVEDSTGVNHKAQRSHVLRAESRRQYPLSLEATGLCIARTVTAPGKEIAAAGEGIAQDGRDSDV